MHQSIVLSNQIYTSIIIPFIMCVQANNTDIVTKLCVAESCIHTCNI